MADRPPVIAAWGAGVDSTAMIVELAERGEPIDMVLFADPGAEKPETYAYLAMMREWMADRGIRHETVRYVTRRFKNWPPYDDLAGSLLTNGCLPSIAFGRHSCSLKYKAAPQEAFIRAWPPALAAFPEPVGPAPMAPAPLVSPTPPAMSADVWLWTLRLF